MSNLNIFRACCGELNPTGFRILSGTVIHLFVILLISSYPLAQVSRGGTPYGIALGLSRSSVPTITMPTVNIDSLIAVGNAEDPTLPNRIGYSHSVNLSTVNSGFWEDLNDGGRLWRLQITSQDAISISLLYNQYWLQQGAKLFIYNEDESMVVGAFTEYNNKQIGRAHV